MKISKTRVLKEAPPHPYQTKLIALLLICSGSLSFRSILRKRGKTMPHKHPCLELVSRLRLQIQKDWRHVSKISTANLQASISSKVVSPCSSCTPGIKTINGRTGTFEPSLSRCERDPFLTLSTCPKQQRHGGHWNGHLKGFAVTCSLGSSQHVISQFTTSDNHIASHPMTSQPTTSHNHTTSHPIASHRITTTRRNGWRLALRTFYRQILSPWSGFFPLKLPPPYLARDSFDFRWIFWFGIQQKIAYRNLQQYIKAISKPTKSFKPWNESPPSFEVDGCLTACLLIHIHLMSR